MRRRGGRSIFIVLSIFLAAAAALPASYAQGGGPGGWAADDSIFSADDAPGGELGAPVAPVEGSEASADARAATIGGYLRSSYAALATWQDSYPDPRRPTSGLAQAVDPDLRADLYLDARPFTDFRVFGKLRAAYPFAAPDFRVLELYADLDWSRRAFFRAGRQVLNWGVGYFFSPADLVSLTPIDPLFPAAEREGPLAIKANLPFGEVDNLYLYALADERDPGDGPLRVEDLAWAARVEVVAGRFELGAGALYGPGRRPTGMLTASGSLFGDFGIFGEAVASLGSDRVLVEPAAAGPLGLDYRSYEDTDGFRASWALGLRFLSREAKFSAYAQYFANGNGYASLEDETGALALYAAQRVASDEAAVSQGPRLSSNDVAQLGSSYVAASIAWREVGGSDFDLEGFFEANLSDGSAVASPRLVLTPFERCSISLASFFCYGDSDGELPRRFGRFALSLELTLGEGAF